MYHRHAGRKLGWKSAHRTAALRSLSTSLFDKERIQTTLPRAKTLRPFAEKLITISKREGIHARRLVAREIHDPRVVKKLFDTISARFTDRPGGYTRILRLGRRQGDGAEMAIVELVGYELPTAAETEKKKKSVGERIAGRLRGKKKEAGEGEAAPEAGEAAEKPSRSGAGAKRARSTKKPSKP